MSSTPLNSTIQTLADFSSSDLVVVEVKGHTADAALLELCSVLYNRGHIPDSSRFNQAVLARESIGTTSFVKGWALPHARMSEIPELKFVVGRTAEPVPWFGTAASQVQTIFLFAVPGGGGRDYLNVVAALARLSQNALMVERLNLASSAEDIFSLLQEVPLPYTPVARTHSRNPSGQVASP